MKLLNSQSINEKFVHSLKHRGTYEHFQQINSNKEHFLQQLERNVLWKNTAQFGEKLCK